MERRTFLWSGLAAGLATAGTPITARELAAAQPVPTPNGVLRLNANENPLGMVASARQAVLGGMDGTNRYPFEAHGPFIEKLADYLGTNTESLVLGTGSTEILQVAVDVFSQHGAKFIAAHPTFEDLSDYAVPWDLEVATVPLRSDLSHDLPAMRAIAEATDGAAVVYICNPNNPTGTLTDCGELDSWIRSARSNTYFIVDEAYYEYAQDHPKYWTSQKWIDTHRNVIVARTFSKIFGMAGMRLGFGLAHPETAAKLRGLATQNNVNYLAYMAGLASLNDENLVPHGLASNRAGKEVMINVLDELGIEYIPSHTNFMMHKITTDVATHQARMLAEGIGVGRPFAPMLDYNRVSIATADEMQQFATALRKFRKNGWI